MKQHFFVVVIFICIHVFGTVNVDFFSTGCNRFEVTLEKSNKNFSKKIQQVGSDGGGHKNIWLLWDPVKARTLVTFINSLSPLLCVLSFMQGSLSIRHVPEILFHKQKLWLHINRNQILVIGISSLVPFSTSWIFAKLCQKCLTLIICCFPDPCGFPV